MFVALFPDCRIRNLAIVRPQRFHRPYEHAHRGPAINDRIRAHKVFLIDENNEKVGVVETIEALRRSHAAGLDLVEVAADSTPPVCRILDFGKYKYELAKKEKASKAKSKAVEMKEVRLGRSMKIDPHDIEIRLQQAHRFLMEGHKVQIVQNFRGRELMHRQRGEERMKHIIERLADVSKVESTPRMAGRRMSVILAPDKAKIDALNRRKAATAKQAGGDGSPAAQPAPAVSAASSSASDAAPVPAAASAKRAPAPKKPAMSRSA